MGMFERYLLSNIPILGIYVKFRGVTKLQKSNFFEGLLLILIPSLQKISHFREMEQK